MADKKLSPRERADALLRALAGPPSPSDKAAALADLVPALAGMARVPAPATAAKPDGAPTEAELVAKQRQLEHEAAEVRWRVLQDEIETVKATLAAIRGGSK